MPNKNNPVEEIKKNWLVMVMSGIISLMISVSLLSMGFKRDDTKILNEKIEEKATKIELKETYNYINQQDGAIIRQLQAYQDEERQKRDIEQKWMQSIDAKLNILIDKR